MRWSWIFAGVIALTPGFEEVHAQVIPPGYLHIDGIQVNCGPYPTIVTPQIADSAMFNGQAILLNPVVLSRMPTTLKLYTYGHECGHAMVGASETDADCWSVRTGRDQGWFPPQAFQLLIAMFRNNPGDLTHPPGPARVANMISCYSRP